MVSPRFLDTVQTLPPVVRQASSPNPGVAIAGGVQSGFFFDSGTAPGELIQHYTYWNYVAITRICDRASTQFPQIGFKTNLPAMQPLPQASGVRSRPYITQSQREHLTRFYGSVLQSHEDLQPIPEGHPLATLLSQVNPDDTFQSLIEDTLLFLQLTGEFYWWLIPSRIQMATGYKMPAQIWLIPTHFITGWNLNDDGTIKSYTMIPNGLRAYRQEIPAEEILHYAKKNPHSRTRGHSAISAAPFWTLNAENIEASRHAGFKNGINPDLIVTLGKDASPTTPSGESMVKVIKERLMQRAAGFMRNREPVVVPPGVEKIEKWSNTPREMDYGSSADQSRDQGLALHGVPKVIAGITTDVNRATVEGANVVFCENVLNPTLAKLAGFMTEKLAYRYDPRIRIWYQDCTPRNAEQELRETQLDWSMGAITPDERRVDRGRQPIGETAYESAYIGSSLVPLSETLKEENMERALEIAGKRGEDDPNAEDDPDAEETDDEKTSGKPKGEKPASDPVDDEADDEGDDAKKPEKKPAKKKQSVGAGSFPSLDQL